VEDSWLEGVDNSVEKLTSDGSDTRDASLCGSGKFSDCATSTSFWSCRIVNAVKKLDIRSQQHNGNSPLEFMPVYKRSMARSMVYSSSWAAERDFVASCAFSTRDTRIGIAATGYKLANVIPKPEKVFTVYRLFLKQKKKTIRTVGRDECDINKESFTEQLVPSVRGPKDATIDVSRELAEEADERVERQRRHL